eukprot:m.280978 g.280978  ORF g.280978 m.280978 type:complete len:257 (+) comp19833_c0_seq11:244-1014(+)
MSEENDPQRDKSRIQSQEESQFYRQMLVDSGMHKQGVNRKMCGTAADWFALQPQNEDGRARSAPPSYSTARAAILYSSAIAATPRCHQICTDQSQLPHTLTYDLELLGVCYTNVRNRNCDDSALLPTDRKRFNICDQCTFITRLHRQHKKRLVSNDRVYCTFTETDEQWDTFCDKLREEHQASDKQIMVAYGKSAATVLEQMFTAKAISTKRNHNIVMESQYTPAIYDVRVGVTPEVRVTQEALVSPAETTTINFP